VAIVDVVKYNGGPELFAWRFPSDEFGSCTRLTVNKPYEAVLCKDGKALDAFGGGSHTLEGANAPLQGKMIHPSKNGKDSFEAEIWYVDTVHSFDVRWGTASPLKLQDPEYGVVVPARLTGEFGVKIADSKKFLTKLVGSLPLFDRSGIVIFFRGLYLAKLKDSVTSYLLHKQIGVLEADSDPDELSAYLKIRTEPVFEEYGVRLVHFYIGDFSVPEDDPAVLKLKELAAAKERAGAGAEDIAENPDKPPEKPKGTDAGPTAVDAPDGKEAGAAGEINEAAGANEMKECPKCHSAMDKNKRFCGDCGCDTQKSSGKAAEIRCSACGTAMTKKNKFCPECGKKYNPCPKCGADLPTDVVECEFCGYETFLPCPSCGKPLEGKNLKFCPECGFSLLKKCPKCESVVKGDPKFCPECGETLKQ